MNLSEIEIPKDIQVNTDEELEAVLSRISFHNSVLDFNWRYRFRPYYEVTAEPTNWTTDGRAYVADGRPFGADAVKAGWLLWVEFERPDIHTGQMGWGRGRDEIVRKGAYESGVVKTAWVLYEMIVRHETMEGFQYNGVRIFNPHNSVHELSLPALVAQAKRQDEAKEASFRNSVVGVSGG